MPGLLASRRRLMARHGRTMTLRRQTALRPPAYDAIEVRGVFRAFTAEQLTQGLQQGDASVALLADDVAAMPPRTGDQLLIDGRTWVIQGAPPVHDGATLIGHTLHIRGGA